MTFPTVTAPPPRFRLFRGDRPLDALAPDDRGLAYGDGLFETMRAHRGDVPWWEAHWARLAQGAARLGLPLPDPAQVRAEAGALLAGDDAVLKLVVTRGSGGRGYAPPGDVTPVWLLSRHPLPPAAPEEGIVLRWCRTALALQPALAGMKHCNRLEQVLARREWDEPGSADRDADEGLMCSTEGDVVCVTAGNLFALRGGRWHTPPVDRCGVAGVCRAWLVPRTQAVVVRLSPEDVERAEALFVCNAVRGILPVARLGRRRWPPHPAVDALRRALADAHPGLVL